MPANTEMQIGLIDKATELVITDENFEIVFRNNVFDFDDSTWKKWTLQISDEEFSDNVVQWEIVDKASGKYFSINSYKDVYEGNTYLLHHIYDVSDYSELIKDLSKYSRKLRNISDCQSDLIKSLSGNPAACLPAAIKYFAASRAMLCINRTDCTECFIKKKGEASLEAVRLEAGENPDTEGLILCCSGKTVTEVEYAMYISDDTPEDDTSNRMLKGEFKFFIENALMQEAIIYESEHDRLTGLFNKGKYMELQDTVFKEADSIAVYSMDVNYLKRINDTLGHREGDRLISKAAESIKAINPHNAPHSVYGFRTGGDEFIVVVVNEDLGFCENLKNEWRRKLDELNEAGGPECIIACGMCHKKAPFSFKEVFSEADELMYEEKRAIKLARGDDPDAR